MCKAPETAPTYPEVQPAPATTPEEVIRTEAWIERKIREHGMSWRVEVKGQPDGGWKVVAEGPGLVLQVPDFMTPRQVVDLAVHNIYSLWRCQRQNQLAK